MSEPISMLILPNVGQADKFILLSCYPLVAKTTKCNIYAILHLYLTAQQHTGSDGVYNDNVHMFFVKQIIMKESECLHVNIGVYISVNRVGVYWL